LQNKCDIQQPFFINSTATKINVTTEKLIKTVNNENIGIIIFAHCTSNSGFFQQAGDPDRRKKFCETFFQEDGAFIFEVKESSKANDVKEKLKGWSLDISKFPIISSSDANEANRVGKYFTWIKADPTFEGLKQIIYEPDERIKIQENNPLNDYSKPFFSEIKINNTNLFVDSGVEFSETKLPFNPNLVAIIGGRGTGKSILLDAIAKTFGKENDNKRIGNIVIEENDFIIKYKKDYESTNEYSIQQLNTLDYLHIHQGDVKKIVDPENPKRLDAEIKRLLNLPEKPITNISIDESTLNRLIDEVFEIKDYLNKQEEKGVFVNSENYITNEISKKSDLIANITTKDNKDLIYQYSENLKSTGNCDVMMSKLDKLKNELEYFKKQKNKVIDEINSTITDDNLLIPLINFHSQEQKITNLFKTKSKKKEELENDNIKIKEDFIKKGITGDISTLLEQVKIYQNEIQELEEKKKIVLEKKAILDEKFNEITQIADKLSEAKKSYIKDINEKWEALKQGKEDWNINKKKLVSELIKNIKIEANEDFNIDKFYKMIKECLNLRKFREVEKQNQIDRIKETFNINSRNDFLQLLKNKHIIKDDDRNKKCLSEILDSDLFVRDGAKSFLKTLILENAAYWSVIAKSKYKNKDLHQISVGMKGTMYVCLKLATDPFLKSFVFDQPEDDLDNDFIMNELVPIFKRIKKYRQVIIVTHNANLVVNADAEQVVVAENNDEKISYTAGSIENKTIRENICKILEGGEIAFKQRERKYAIK